jgi:hypothetical protein
VFVGEYELRNKNQYGNNKKLYSKSVCGFDLTSDAMLALWLRLVLLW